MYRDKPNKATPFGSVSGSANQNCCIGPNLKVKTYRQSVSLQTKLTTQFGSLYLVQRTKIGVSVLTLVISLIAYSCSSTAVTQNEL